MTDLPSQVDLAESGAEPKLSGVVASGEGTKYWERWRL